MGWFLISVPRGRIELPTPAFSGQRSTTELPRLNPFGLEAEEKDISRAFLECKSSNSLRP